MPYITEQDKQKLLSSIHIEDEIGKKLSLKQAGVNRLGLCPFHDDRTASLTVSPAKQIYKCFACGAAGNVIDFVMQYDSLSYNEACTRLAKEYHIELSGETPMSEDEIRKQKTRESALIALDRANQTYTRQLQESPEALAYVSEKRGFDEKTIQLFSIGYANNANTLTKSGMSLPVLKDAGLIKTKEETGYTYDAFFNRITFPYYNLTGQIIGFTGRTLDADCNIKYCNTADTLLFSKGHNLFGLYQAKQSIAQKDKAYFMEGQADVISCVQYGLSNAVCGSGTSLTEDQIKLLHRFCSTVVLIYDQDRAGIKAAIRSAKLFLSFGMNVRGVLLPEGEDPDSFARKEKDKLVKTLLKKELTTVEYLVRLLKKENTDNFEKSAQLDTLCECIGVIPDNVVRQNCMKDCARLMEVALSEVSARTRLKKQIRIENWKDGVYGMEDAVELLKEDPEQNCMLTLSQETFIAAYEQEQPIVYLSGTPSINDLQRLRNALSSFIIEETESIRPAKYEPDGLILLKTLFREGFDLTIKRKSSVKKGEQTSELIEHFAFSEYYVQNYGERIVSEPDSNFKTEVIKRCLEVIAGENDTTRNIRLKTYADALEVDKSVLTKLLKPILAKKKNSIDFETQKISSNNLVEIDPQKIPDYVMDNPEMHDEYIRSKYYPWIDKNGRPVAYVFQNQNGSGHTVLSDFYIEPLLHVNDDFGGNKMVVKLNHIHPQYDKYVELPSNTFASFQTLNVRLVEEGPYNFEGSALQYKKIWRSVSYGFRRCIELKIFGQQPEGFFAFSNAIYHQVDGKYKLEYVDELGVVSHKGDNFYSPAYSKIHIKTRNENDNYRQARSVIYKDIPKDQQLSFDGWAKLMDDVYSVNDNGKWGVLFAITSAFRDYLFKQRAFFTALFFIGPTGSGKTQIAESIRNLFVDSTTPSFNLNTGTDAAFFMLLECQKNIIQVMEEYNDRDISQTKFQGLKSATLDGEGKIKVKDIGSKTMDSSVINAALIILGQEASQQDDGALSNRCIIRDVPYRTTEFTEEETAIYHKLKEHERIGLCNILIDILSLRPLIETQYLRIFDEEVKKIKESVKVNLTNTEGLARIINAVGLMVATCRFVEEFAEGMNLPFTYTEFFQLGCNTVLNQLDRISSSNKLTTYFKAISTLLTNREIIPGREFKIQETTRVTIKMTGKNKEQKEFDNPVKVLYLDFNEIYVKYKKMVGEKESLTEASLRSYFDSNKAYIGLCSSTVFKWTETDWTGGSPVFNQNTLETAAPQTEIRAQHVVSTRSKNTSAYMFNYELLREYMDIDLERIDESNTTVTESKPVECLPF